MTQVTGLSGNEIFCLAKKNMRPGEIVVGNSVNSMGFFGSIGAGVGNILGGEIAQITSVIHDGRAHAFSRMVREAIQHDADGVAGVTSELRSLRGKTEFLFVGSAVHVPGNTKALFTSAGDAQELYCHMDAGYQPLQHVFGNVAYSMGIGGNILGSLKTMVRGEIREFSDIFNVTRHVALERLVKQAKASGANSVVGIRTTIEKWMGVHEMLMTGTAAFNSDLPQWASLNPVTSDMTGEELWSMTSLGFAPVKLLMSTSIYSLGLIGGFLATVKSIKKGEISDLTTLIHDARVNAVDRLKREASEIGADEVIGVKTYIAEIGNGLVEFMAIGTAVKKISGMTVKTSALPVQAIIRDRDTWIDGEFGVSLDRQSA
ncbi:heavy metal-binding domain-containing protein [Undibacterium sp. JH2W]|uniref:heavy metal-binding domain-containing protein n=1 Tax=Undibacterium sp. JH2W TaxID=3413037 RepID=UPI003BEFFF84